MTNFDQAKKEDPIAFLASVADNKHLWLAQRDSMICLKQAVGCLHAKAFVISMQKAGTYLVAKLLENLGLIDLEVHISSEVFTDYRNKTLQQKIDDAWNSNFSLPVELSLSLVQEGQFAVGHLYHDARHMRVLESFQRFVCIRDARDALTSMMRFECRRISADPRRYPDRREWIHEQNSQQRMLQFMHLFGDQLMKDFAAIQPWCLDPATLVVKFEDLLGDNGEALQAALVHRICDKIGAKSDADWHSTLSRSLFVDTLTFSGSRTQHQEFWSDLVEEKFNSIGGEYVNSKLGYTSRK